MMISSPNIVGLRTSTAASRMISSRLLPSIRSWADVPHAVLDHHHRAIDDHAKIDRPQAQQAGGDAEPQHPQKANSIESGMATATISAARRLPRKANSTATTSSPPSNRFLRTVSMT